MPTIRVYSSGIHVGEEPTIVGNERSGLVFFSGCHLACNFCYTPETSRRNLGNDLSLEGLSQRFEALLQDGARNLNLISPTPQWLRMVDTVRAFQNRSAVPLVLKMSGFESKALLRSAAFAQVFVPDFKVVSSEAARAVGLPDNYGTVTREGIATLLETHGKVEHNADGRIARGILVRHLLMPGFELEAEKVIETLAELRFRGALNLMTLFLESSRHRIVRAPEATVERLVERAQEVGLSVLVNGRPFEKKEIRYAS